MKECTYPKSALTTGASGHDQIKCQHFGRLRQGAWSNNSRKSLILNDLEARLAQQLGILAHTAHSKRLIATVKERWTNIGHSFFEVSIRFPLLACP